MGKQRRKRRQYHFSSNQDKDENENITKSSETVVSGFNIDVPEDIFKNVDINMDDVKKNLIDEDSKSVRSVKSISKSVKSFKRSLGVHLKKADIKTLRRNLFLRKIQQSYEHLDKSKKGNKKQESNLLSISEMDKVLPSLNMLYHEPKQSKERQPLPNNAPKLRGIDKAKNRKKAMLSNLDGFKKLLRDASFKSDPMNVLTNCIEQKVFDEGV